MKPVPIAAFLCISAVAALHAQTDVPAGHWAGASVTTVVTRGVMDAPGGKFDGGRKVTRIELANTLARFARSLEKGDWGGSAPSVTKRKHPAKSAWDKAPVTRYELAALLDRVGRNVMAGLPKPTGKTFGESEALPKGSLTGVAKDSPAYESISYLANNRMVWGDSVLLKPTTAAVTGKDVGIAVTMMIAGLNDRLTDEPQNREDLGEPPSHQRDK